MYERTRIGRQAGGLRPVSQCRYIRAMRTRRVSEKLELGKAVRLVHLLPASVSVSLAANPLPQPPPSSEARPRVVKVTYVNVKAGEDGSRDVVTVVQPPDGAQSPRDFIEEQAKVATAVAAGPPTVVIETGTHVAGKSEEGDGEDRREEEEGKAEEEEKAEEVAVVAAAVAEVRLEEEEAGDEPEVEVEASVGEYNVANASDESEGEKSDEAVETGKPSEEEATEEKSTEVVPVENTPEPETGVSPVVSEVDKADGAEVVESEEKGESTEEKASPDSEPEPAQPSNGIHLLFLCGGCLPSD